MKKLLAALVIAATAALPASATPETRYTTDVVNPGELMVLVPGLEWIGYSRISTVEFCQETNDVEDWMNLITDDEFEQMEACLAEMS